MWSKWLPFYCYYFWITSLSFWWKVASGNLLNIILQKLLGLFIKDYAFKYPVTSVKRVKSNNWPRIDVSKIKKLYSIGQQTLGYFASKISKWEKLTGLLCLMYYAQMGYISLKILLHNKSHLSYETRSGNYRNINILEVHVIIWSLKGQK